jgi:cell division transport system permease protein
LLLVIATALINNTIRLSVYSKRFVIRSMQLVGATQAFIRRPFVVKGIYQGILSGIIALVLLSLILAAARENIPELTLLSSPELMMALYGFVLLVGVIVSGISTIFAVGRYLNVKPDRLYA